ncbi:hypothetical protein [Achromobacter aloeverae]
MAYGVTPDGFVRMRLPEIRQEIVASLQAKLRAAGYTGVVETRPDSVTGLLIDTFAEREAAIWELAEGIYYAMYPGSATGVSLTRSVSFTGVQRINAEVSTCYVMLYGASATPVPAGAQIRHRITQSLWEIAADTTIGAGAAGDITLQPSVAPTTTYTVTIDGHGYTYTSGATTSIEAILAGLVAVLSGQGFNVSSDGAAVRIFGDGRVSFTAAWSPSLTLLNLGTPALAQTLQPAAEEADVGDLNAVVSQVPGWTAVDNLQAGSVGRLAETEAELRARYPTGVYRLGAATEPSIAPNIRDGVRGIRAVKVYRNNGDEVDEDGRPPHSVHVVVDGGLDDEVALAIFKVVAGGIDTFGQQTVIVRDSEGADHPIHFDRPEPIYVWVSCATTLLPTSEQVFPPDGFDQIKKNLAAEGDSFGVGDDVIIQRLYGAIYKTTGISSADLRLAYSTDPAFTPQPADFAATNITVEPFQLARFDLSRIEVT